MLPRYSAMKRKSLFIFPLAVAMALASGAAIAQTQINWNVPSGAYSVADNWDSMFGSVLPDASFDEVANIGNGGTAFVDNTLNPATQPEPGGVIIQGNSTLEIRSGGTLTVLVGGT